VIGAEKTPRIAQFGSTNRVASMRATVNQDMKLLIPATDDDDLILANPIHKEITGIRDLRFVAHKIPATSKYALKLLLVDLGVREDMTLEYAPGWIKTSRHIHAPVTRDHAVYHRTPPISIDTGPG
jgi:hypothetical protein